MHIFLIFSRLISTSLDNTIRIWDPKGISLKFSILFKNKFKIQDMTCMSILENVNFSEIRLI